MRRRPVRLVQAVVVAAATAFLLAVVVAGGTDRAAAPPPTGFDLVAPAAGGPAGVVYLLPRGARLAGTVAVWGLAPGSRHYAALRGPGATCRGRVAQVVAPLPLLVADARGVATASLDLPRPSVTPAQGLGLTVHADADAASATVVCGTAPGGTGAG